jgi:hypothetical protein
MVTRVGVCGVTILSARTRGVRRREVFSAQFDGGQSAATYGTSIHLGCDVLEQRIVLTASESDFVFSQGTITGYTGAGGVVDIPSKIGGVPVVTIGASAFDGAGLTAVTIPGTVRSIGNHAFGNNAALTRVRFVGNAPNVGTDRDGEHGDLFTGCVPDHHKGHRFRSGRPVGQQGDVRQWRSRLCGRGDCDVADGEHRYAALQKRAPEGHRDDEHWRFERQAEASGDVPRRTPEVFERFLGTR